MNCFTTQRFRLVVRGPGSPALLPQSTHSLLTVVGSTVDTQNLGISPLHKCLKSESKGSASCSTGSQSSEAHKHVFTLPVCYWVAHSMHLPTLRLRRSKRSGSERCASFAEGYAPKVQAHLSLPNTLGAPP